MHPRRSRSATPRPPAATPTTLSLRSSTAGWYAEWKAKKTAAPDAPPAAPDAPPADGAAPADERAAALAKWLTGGS